MVGYRRWVDGWLLILAIVLPIAELDAQPPVARKLPGPALAIQSAEKPREWAPFELSAKAFADAFNKRDPNAISQLWAANGEYINEAGERFAGRPAIAKEYARFFANNPKAKIGVAVKNVRMTQNGNAIEEGLATVELGSGETASQGRYTAVHAKVDGRWLMQSVQDLPDQPTSMPLDDLDWLVGSWIAEENGGEMEVTVRWIANRQFLERTYQVKRKDKVVASGTQIMGWNPQVGRIQSWVFTSDGGHAMGIWTPRKNGWAIETHGMMADGTPTQAVNLLSRIDDNAFSWQSVERSARNAPVPDTEAVLLKRVAAER